MSYKTRRFFAIMGLTFSLAASLVACSDTGSIVNSENTLNETSVSIEQKARDDVFSDRDYDASYDAAEATMVELSGDYTITEEGTYVFSGKLSDGQIIVDAEDQKVQIVLNGVEISSSNSACIYVKNADKVFVTLEEGTTNILTTTGTFETDGDINVDGVIFSKSDLTLNGSGSLQIISEEANGIVSKDELVITSGVYDISAAKHGLEANDIIAIADGKITVAESYEGFEAAEILINGGEINITSSDDGINASGDTAENILVINDGVVEVNANGDGLDSNGTLEINGGYVLVSGSTDNGNSALDFEYSGIITGGTVIGTGSSGMIEALGNDTTQVTMTIGLNSYVEGEFVVKDSSGNEIIAITPAKKYNCIIVSSADFKTGETYTVTAGGESQEIEVTDILYSNVQGMGGMGRSGGMGSAGDFKSRESFEGQKNFDGQRGFVNSTHTP